MKPKKYYESPSLEILAFYEVDVLTVSEGENLTPDGEYDDVEWL